MIIVDSATTTLRRVALSWRPSQRNADARVLH